MFKYIILKYLNALSKQIQDLKHKPKNKSLSYDSVIQRYARAEVQKQSIVQKKKKYIFFSANHLEIFSLTCLSRFNSPLISLDESMSVYLA